MNANVQKITGVEQKIAMSSLGSLFESNRIKSTESNVVKIKLQDADDFVSIPLKAFELLKAALTNMAEGKPVALVALDAELSTRQAANFLGFSRPFLVKLLNKGEIPFRKTGTHYRILFKDVLDYEAKVKAERSKILDELAKEAQELNLGY